MFWKARINTALGRRPLRLVKVAHDASGLDVKIDDARVGVQERSLKWEDVESAIAFKIDAVTYDVITLRFVTADGAVDVDEEAEGWMELLDALPRYLLGALTGHAIFDAVALPPFDTNATEVYKRRE